MQCQLMESFFEAIRQIHKENSVARDYGTGVPLYHSEVNLLDAIYRHPEYSAATLANALGITKGALTQTARKLIDKGLIEQYNPPGNRKLKFHKLTAGGETARLGHAQFHKNANDRMKSYLCSLPQENKQILGDFFRVLESCGQVCLYSCEMTGCVCHTHSNNTADEKGGKADVGA